MLSKRIIEDMKQSMKSGNRLQLSTIRMLRAAIRDKEIEIGHALTEADIHAVIAKMVKQRRDSATQYASGGRHDLEAGELAEVEFLQVYLPKQLEDQQLVAIVRRVIADVGIEDMRGMGKVMAALKSELQGRAEMGRVNTLVKKMLT